ncbi:MAG: hypothetical protein QOF93_868 [Verrucomicrobiota bacterium]|jgi:hypothetical protein
MDGCAARVAARESGDERVQSQYGGCAAVKWMQRHVAARHDRAEQLECASLRVQLEIDLNVVVIALAESVGQGVNSADAIREHFD